MRRVHLPLDSLPFDSTPPAWESSGGANTIPFQTSLERWKPIGPQRGLLSTSPRWGSGDARYREPLAHREAGLPGPIVSDGRGMGP